MASATPSAVLEVVLAVAAEIGEQPVTSQTNLIAEGWDSLDTIEFGAALEERLAVPCSFEDVFDAADLGALADLLAGRVAQAPAGP